MNNMLEGQVHGRSPTPAAVLTPVSEEGVRALFEGLAAVNETSQFGGPANAGIAVTPSLFGLLQQCCGSDPRFEKVMSNIWQMEYRSMKEHANYPEESDFAVRQRRKPSILARLFGRS